MFLPIALAIAALFSQNTYPTPGPGRQATLLPIHAAGSCWTADPTFSCTITGVSSGDVLIFFSANYNGNGTPPLSDSICGNSSFWHSLQSAAQSFNAVQLWYCQPLSSGSDTINVTPATNASFVVIDVTRTTTAAIDASVAFALSSSSLTVTTNNLTTTVSGDFLIACESYEFGSTTMAANNSFTWIQGSGTGTNGRSPNCFGKAAGAAGSYNTTFTNNNSGSNRSFYATMVAIKP